MTQELKLRSFFKAITYRLVIIALDFLVIYLMTGKILIAVGFMLISNTYTTIAYFIHERIWNKIAWGIDNNSKIKTYSDNQL